MNVSIKREQRELVPSAEREKSRLQANRLLSIALVCLLQVSLAVASTFNLSVGVTPNGAGSLNTSGGTYEEGSSVYLRTYNNTGYVFKGWYEGETLLSSSTSFNYTMPSKDVTVQARYEYDPAVPDNPAMADTTTYYSFTATVSPLGAGSLNTYNGKYAANAKINLRAYNNTGYLFVGWQNEVGETVSSSASFNYTMPRHDSQLTALYIYDPTVPANPDSMATRYTVTVDCKPVGGGTFNTTSATAEEGGNVRLYAYTNTGFKFLRWENEQGETISTAQNFYYVIPHGNSKVYGIFEYDPAVPGNPNKNYWNKELGEVIVDDFTPGNLGSAVSTVISGSDRSEVAMITVAGVMNDNDFGIANNYSNCTLLDLSRVTGITQVPSYAFDYTNLESVYLPATIEKICYRAFYECKQLSALTIYAMTPPALENQVFTNVPEGLVVYVPAAAIAQYQDTDGWKDFTILPIQEDIRTISISLPEGTNVQDYKQMWLELTNTKSGQRMHYVMTDRMQYTFANIIRNTTWNVVLRNERGDVFGQIDNVEVEDEDVSVMFTSLSKPQSVALSVLTPDGQDVTSQTQITWTDVSGNYLAQGTSLSGLPVGYQATYSIALSQDLAMTYITPQPVNYILKDGNNIITCQLSPIPQVQLSGKVKDVATGLPLSGAVISASQTYGGKYSKTLNAKTDSKGIFTLEVANVPTTIAFAATDYVSQTLDFSNNEFDGLSEFSVPDVSLKSITGAIISLNLTYTTCEGETQNWYSDYQNVSYTLYNITKQQAISQFNVQYPQIVLLEEVEDGDELKLTATSRVNAFKAVETTTTIAEQKAEATFAIVELGKIQARFAKTGNASIVGSLYDAVGKLVKTGNYLNASLTISNLADGQYTLVSMGSSRLFNTIYDLAQLPQTGLVEGSDYVQNSVKLKSGQVSTISINEVPTLDESKLYYTGDNTSFTVNKSSIVAGNYLTLTGHIDFKPAYATSVSNVNLIVDLPESCEFVENSVMVGNSTSSYILNGNQITIPMARYTDRVRFCVIPTLGGEYAPSAFAQFDLNGETITQPIGSASYNCKNLSISVPSTVAKSIVPISGYAPKGSIVYIYDNNILVGQTKALATGSWTCKIDLQTPKNLSSHEIFAKIQMTDGTLLQSETQVLQYNISAILVSSVKMLNTAHGATSLALLEYETLFDFQNPNLSPQTYWYWPNYPDFTFIIDLTNNDSTIVSNVKVHVKTTANDIVAIRAFYDSDKDVWIAKKQFYSDALPVNLSVSYDYADYSIVDSLAFVNAIEKSYEKVSLADFVDENQVLTYSLCPLDNTLGVKCLYYRDAISRKNLYETILNTPFEEVAVNENSGRYKFYSIDSRAYQIVEESIDSIFVFSVFNYDEDTLFNQYASLLRDNEIVNNKSNAPRRVWSYGTTEDHVPPSTDRLNQWRDRIIQRAIDEANRKLPCADEYERIQIHNAIAKLRQCVGFSLGGFLAYTAGWGLTATPGSHPIERAYQVWDASNNTANFAEGIQGLSNAAQQHLQTIHNAPECGDNNGSGGDSSGDSGNENARNVMDPSGFVYEGVVSNRIEGVTATAYYKEMIEDMYGDLHEYIVKWDASEYAQENPLFTNEYGMYAWDVPNGLWQVKFEKEGYETTYSDWLPVPPPQLDVNIAIKQNVQPEVKNARAYEDAVEVEFDKYMMPELLTSENITVMQYGTAVEGTIELLNEEESYEGEEETFASKIRFNAAEPFTEREITLMVNNRVKSYAGIRMQDNYRQTFTIEQEIKQIVSDSLTVVNYGESSTLFVQVLPASASKGKTLTVKSSSSMILGVETEQMMIDNDGKAKVIITGELPGTAVLTFSVEGTDKTSLTIVNVEVNKTVAIPTASIASGSQVEKGTQVELFCATEGATIYYTLDGSCPCVSSEARKVYDGTPIMIDKNTVIKAMATAPDMGESEVATFVYIVTNGDLNDDEKVDIADGVTILNLMAEGKYNELADFNHDHVIDIADFVFILNIMAEQDDADDQTHFGLTTGVGIRREIEILKSPYSEKKEE